jgi:hypothetical protein
MTSRGERGIWQRRYWEHTIRDEPDFVRHFDYIHFNPVKQGLVAHPTDWPYSTLRRWVGSGMYPNDWEGLGDEPAQTGDRQWLPAPTPIKGGMRCAAPPYACYFLVGYDPMVVYG